MLGETITVTRTTLGGRDEHGNQTVGTSTSWPLDGFAVAASSTGDDSSVVGTRVITGFILYRRKPADIRTTDTLTIRGQSGWKVDGEVFPWVNPYKARQRGIQFTVKRGA